MARRVIRNQRRIEYSTEPTRLYPWVTAFRIGVSRDKPNAFSTYLVGQIGGQPGPTLTPAQLRDLGQWCIEAAGRLEGD